jgi:hypothetical protein
MIVATKAISSWLVFILALLSALVVVVALLALPGSAFAGEPFAVTKFESAIVNEAGEAETQAGSHPYAMTTAFQFASHEEGEEGEHHIVPSGSVKGLEVGLPPGVIVNPNATQTKCPEATLDSLSISLKCPVTSVVGVVHVTLGIVPHGTTGVFPVYNMVAPPGVPAELGFELSEIGLVVHIYGGVGTGGGYGLSATTKEVLGRGLVDAAAVTLWGDPTSPAHDTERGVCAEEKGRSSCPVHKLEQPLLTLPTACTGEPLRATVRADSWQEPENFQEKEASSPATTGCKELGDFEPALSVRPTKLAPESPTGLEVTLKIPREENVNALAEADLKEATVTLPAGMAVSPSGANGLGTCPLLRGREPAKEEEESNKKLVGIDLESKQPANCPDNSKLGTVKIVTPLLEAPLEGSVYLAQQGNLPDSSGSNPFKSLFALYLVAEGSGVVVKLPGEVSLDPSTGQVSARFGKDPTTGFYLPQLPFNELNMDFFGGQRAPLVTPSSCGTYTTSSVMTPYGSEADPLLEPVSPSAEPSNSFTLTEGCGARGFAPSFTAGTTNVEAGGFTDETVTFSRNDGEQNIGGITVTTPPGLLGKLSEVELCQEPQAREGACGEGSLIGETTAAVGPGEYPFWLKGGRVYITGPYNGAPYGLSIVEPTTAGPFTLEGNGGFNREVVRASIAVNAKTGALTISSALPTIVDGVPLDIDTINVNISRKNFTFNPTNCEELHVTSSITSTEGATATPSSRFQAANCAALPFDPVFTASTQGNASDRGNGASLNVKVTQKAGEAAMRSVHMELPRKLAARLTTLQKACTEATFNANPASCPAASIVGTGVAYTPVLKAPLEGPAYFVSHGGAQYPELVFVLQGEGVTIDLAGETHIDPKTNVASNTFTSVPDAPVESFEANLPEKPNSALAGLTPKGLCGSASLSMPMTIVGQNGAEIRQTTKVAITGCPKKATKKHGRTTKKHGRKQHKKSKTRAKGKKAGRRR